MKILALDLGEKRIGVAISDELGLLAHPLETLKNEGIDKLIEYLNNIITAKNIKELVIGIPYALRGTLSFKTKEILKIKKVLEGKLSIPVLEIDERLTTKMANNILQAVGKEPSKNRQIIDQIAATQILQIYLDQKK